MPESDSLEFFDTHAHLDLEAFDEDRPLVVERAREAGVCEVLTVGITAVSSQHAVQLTKHFSGLYAAVGIHPVDCVVATSEDWENIERLVDEPRVVALGETGLDNYWQRSPLDVQQDWFDRHIRLAQQRDLPLVIHQRECQREILEMLREARRRGPLRGIMHSFTASAEEASECIDLGLHISFAGMLTFKKSDALRAVAASVPDDRLLIETDSPFLAPQPVRGKRNEPAFVVHTARCLAEVRGVSLAEIARLTTTNARRLFGLVAD